MSKNINDLRDAMCDTLSLLKEGKITAEQARAASDIGKVIIDTAKVEVDYIRASKGGVSDFIEPSTSQQLPNGVLGIRTHRLAE